MFSKGSPRAPLEVTKTAAEATEAGAEEEVGEEEANVETAAVAEDETTTGGERLGDPLSDSAVCGRWIGMLMG